MPTSKTIRDELDSRNRQISQRLRSHPPQLPFAFDERHIDHQELCVASTKGKPIDLELCEPILAQLLQREANTRSLQTSFPPDGITTFGDIKN